MNTMADMQKRAVLYLTLLTAPENLDVHVEVKVKMFRGCLHAPYSAFHVKGRTSALTLKSWRTEFEANDSASMIDEIPCHHSLNWKPRSIASASCGPSDFISSRVVSEVGEFWEWKSEATNELAGLQRAPVLREHGKSRTEQSCEIVELEKCHIQRGMKANLQIKWALDAVKESIEDFDGRLTRVSVFSFERPDQLPTVLASWELRTLRLESPIFREHLI